MIGFLSTSFGTLLWLAPCSAALWSLMQILLVITFARISSSAIWGSSNSSRRRSFTPYRRIARVFISILLIKHDLATGYGNRLTCLVGLFDYVEKCLHDVLCATSTIHRHLRFIEPSYIGNTFRPWNLSSFQVLHKQPSLRVRPKRTVK